MNKAIAGEKTIYGAVWTESAAKAYNAINERIASFERAGLPAPQEFLNGRHNIYVSLAR